MLNPKLAQTVSYLILEGGCGALSAIQRVTVQETKELVESIARVNAKPLTC